MDKQLDELSKSRAQGVSRREALRRLGIGLACGLLLPACLNGIAKADGDPGYLVVGSFDTNSVLRYNAATGAFVDTIVPTKSNGLRQPMGVLFGPDHNLYVSNSLEWDNGNGHMNVLRFNGATGAFIDDFADQNQIKSARGILFGPDGNFYVAEGFSGTGIDRILRYDGTTGAFIDNFVGPGSGGLANPCGMVFGPNGKNDGGLDLYVSLDLDNSVLRYDGATGAFKEVFVASGTGGLKNACGMVFGPDGNLYVASPNWFTASPTFAPGAVLRFEGPGGRDPGALIDTFIPGGRGGLCNPFSLLFGPDGNLYVTTMVGLAKSNAGTRGFGAVPGTSGVLGYDGNTGAFLGVFVTADSGGLRFPTFMAFTGTDPMTLNYRR